VIALLAVANAIDTETSTSCRTYVASVAICEVQSRCQIAFLCRNAKGSFIVAGMNGQIHNVEIPVEQRPP